MMGIRSMIVILPLVLSSMAKAQLISPGTLSAAGSSSIANIILEDALGGLSVATLSAGSVILTQDFLQPDAGTNGNPGTGPGVILLGLTSIDNAGTTFSDATTMIEFTLSEFVSTTLNNGDNMLTQGILQPYPGTYWTGLVNSDWKNIQNWSPAFEPTETTEVILPAACPHYPVIVIGVTGKCKSIQAFGGSSMMINSGGLLQLFND
jgi:hypothetical protein